MRQIQGNQNHANYSPKNDKDEPDVALEWTSKFVDGPKTRVIRVFSGKINQGSWNEILHSSTCVRTREFHQFGNVFRRQGDQVRRKNSQEWQDYPLDGEVVLFVRTQEQRTQIVPQGNADNGETRAEGEDDEERQEVLDEEEQGVVGAGAVARCSGPKVQGVQIGEVLEGERPGEREQQVERGDDDEVHGEEFGELGLVGDGEYEGWEGVVAHEGVDAGSEKSGNAWGIFVFS